MAFEHDLGLAQMVGREGRAGRYEIADHVCTAEPGGDLDRSRQHDDLGADAALAEEAPEDVRIGGRDALARERFCTAVIEAVRNRDA